MKQRAAIAIAASLVLVRAPRAHAETTPPPTGAAAPANDKLEAAQADIDAQDARLRTVEKSIAKLLAERSSLQAAPTPPSVPAVKAPAAPPAPATPGVAAPEPPAVTVSGYLQSQYESHQDSQDDLKQGGGLWNQNRFLLRRARLRVEREWEWTSMLLELDGNTVSGPAFGVQKAEASIQYRGSRSAPLGPLAKATLGVFDTPFGQELVESPRKRFFLERSLASRSFFPAEPDLGARVSGEVAWLRWAVAVVNGEPLGSKSGYPLQDPNGGKDLVLRAGVDTTIGSRVELASGVSLLNGKGFHKGTPGTKSSVQWRDLNEDGQIQSLELTPLFGVAPSPSQSFERWLVGADLRLRARSPYGVTSLTAEASAGTNMDRGLYVADPVGAGVDVRELGYQVGLVHELPSWGAFGARMDFYDPNADFLDRQGGKLLPTSQSIRTWSAMAALVTSRARLVLQYDIVRDKLGRDARGVPADLKNDVWTLRLQVEL